MAKKIIKRLRIEKIKGGAANPSPPIGPILGGAGVNIMNFCKQFNARTQDKQGQVCPVVITVYEDKSFEFIVRNPPVSIQLFELTKLKKGSKEPNRTKVAKVDWNQIKTIAENKMSDLNCFRLESAMSMVAGTARSMGIEVSGKAPVHL
ncbi:MAG: 50S ribosomal protein L11 [Flavobacteriales bacterium]